MISAERDGNLRRESTFQDSVQQTYNRGESSFTAPGIFATGADPQEGNFLVVVTIQKGPGPQVKVAGRGLDAKATAGQRTIRGTLIPASGIEASR